jgi:hypothetical protein
MAALTKGSLKSLKYQREQPAPSRVEHADGSAEQEGVTAIPAVE